MIQSLINKLPEPNRETLQCLIRFLVKVCAYSDYNKMKSQYVPGPAHFRALFAVALCMSWS